MVRLAVFSADAIVDAALGLLAEGGPAAASLAAIARKVGAPTGSIYHRFESRAAIIGTAWSRIHGAFVAQVEPPLRAGDGRRAALALVAWARGDARAARVLLLNDAETILDNAPPAALRAAIRKQEDALDAAFAVYLQHSVAPRPIPDAAASRARFLVFDGPIALLRPHLLAGGAVPDFVDAMVAEMHAALAPARSRARSA
jgi:AcrR family transcriptional regulator